MTRVGVVLPVLALLALLALSACEAPPGGAPADAGPAASSAAGVGSAGRARLLWAEHTRSAAAVPEPALVSPDPATRAAAARALARATQAGSLDRLLPVLADGAPGVVAWAAFGLGHACAGRESEVSAALALRAASLFAAEKRDPADFDALRAIAEALARCGGEAAERTLRGWLEAEPPIAEAAAIALGKLGARRGRLDDASFVALLDAASRRAAPLDGALYAFTRLSLPPGPLRARLVSTIDAALARPGFARTLGIRALGRVAEDGTARLSQIAGSPASAPLDGAEAARELARPDPASQRALADALATLVPEDPPALREFVAGPKLATLLGLLGGLAKPDAVARDAIERLAELPIGAEGGAARRVVLARCAAARVLAASTLELRQVRRCDPAPRGRAGKLATLGALDGLKLLGARRERFTALAADDDAVVRQAAVRLLFAHRELSGAPKLLARALADEAPGVVAAAAEVLAKHPERADLRDKDAKDDAEHARRPDPRVIDALVRALSAAQKRSSLEVRGALADAAGALGVLGAKAVLGADCSSEHPMLRARAERALQALGERGRRCERAERASPPATELERLLARPVKLVFDTDAGELELRLDPSSAPVAVTRIVELARSGFYSGIAVHRAVPGFVAQLGDPSGDGYGGAPRPSLLSELAPEPFEANAVGLAESGRDSGSSQFFVALGRFPHLDGEYARLGSAGPGWERVVVGDRIKGVRVVE